MKKTIVGIVTNLEFVSKGIYKKEVHDVNSDYINMIINNGGIPVIIPFVNEVSKLTEILNNIDCLLLIGGEDISPSCYSQSKSIKNKRDIFEIEIYNYFKKCKKPILGICRGLQLINVAEGGTLKNIENSQIKHFIDEDGWINHHEIFINDNTRIKRILNVDKYTVSSVHHQKIEKLGQNIIVSSQSEDGIIESIEYTGDSFIMGFQGHIEKCLDNFSKYNDVIKFFIKEAKYEKR